MGLLETLKSLLGRNESPRRRDDRPPSGTGNESGTTVTVEYEPDAETEAAVKGADVSGGARPDGADTVTDDQQDAVDADGAAESDATDGESPPVEEINGIGPTYAGRLEAAGIETVADLADADIGTVAAAAETAESRASDWIEQARNR